MKPRRILKPEDFDEIDRLLEAGVAQRKIAEQMGLAQTFISRVKRGEVTKENYHYGEEAGKAVATRPSSNYTLEQIDRGLIELAVCGGNANLASRRLALMGHHISNSTLSQWKREKYAQRYVELANTVERELSSELIVRVRERAIQADDAEGRAIELFHEAADEGHTKDAAAAAQAAKALATTKGINIDKEALMTGKPTQITEQRSAAEIAKKWIERGWIDGTAVEIVPPELESGDTD